MNEKRVSITIAIGLGDQTTLFTAEATTGVDEDEIGLARGVLGAKSEEADLFLRSLRDARRGL